MTTTLTIAPELAPRPSAVIVLTGPGCVQCSAEIRHLKSRGIAHEIGDAADVLSDDSLEYLRSVSVDGRIGLPVVIFPDGDIANGFRPDIIESKLDILPKALPVAA